MTGSGVRIPLAAPVRQYLQNVRGSFPARMRDVSLFRVIGSEVRGGSLGRNAFGQIVLPRQFDSHLSVVRFPIFNPSIQVGCGAPYVALLSHRDLDKSLSPRVVLCVAGQNQTLGYHILYMKKTVGQRLSNQLIIPTQRGLDVHLFQVLIRRQISLRGKLNKKR
jgi:hypothetical protein